MNAFRACSDIEQEGERVFIPHFQDYLSERGCLLRKHETREEQALGDYTITNGESSWYIDRKHEVRLSPNMFFEVYSNKEKGRYGWGITTPSRFVVYSFQGFPYYIFVDMKKTRSYLNMDNTYETPPSGYYRVNGQRYRCVIQGKYRQRNVSEGILVPFRDMRDCIHRVLKLDNRTLKSVSFDTFAHALDHALH